VGKRHFLVLTAAAGVADDVGQAARAALQAAGFCAALPRRLAAGALDIGFVGAIPEGLDPRGLLPQAAVDANVVPADTRRKRILLADMDSTIIGVECIDELADFAGVRAAVAAVTEAAMRGELDFEAALEARVQLLEGCPRTCWRGPTMSGCGSTRARGCWCGRWRRAGPRRRWSRADSPYFTERVAAAAGFAEHRANRLGLAGGVLTGRVEAPILGRAAKREALEALCARLGVGPEAAVAIGDGANDLDMVRAAGLGVAYHAKPALAEAAAARLDHSDLTAVLALQGIPEADWVAD
jgi:phosphoserine phosphatase